MAKLFASICEGTVAEAIDAIRSFDEPCDGFEMRVDSIDPSGDRDFDPLEIRRCSELPMIYTRRTCPGSRAMTSVEASRAVESGFELVDLELENPELETIVGAGFRERIILSHHDFESASDPGQVLGTIARYGTGHLKVAMTPRTMTENLGLLALLDDPPAPLTVIGMGGVGLYARTLAPALGSEFFFASLREGRSAAPGQLPVGSARRVLSDPGRGAPLFFAVVGNPVTHSLSPEIHNRYFVANGLGGSYGMIEPSNIEDVLLSLAGGEALAPSGISITAPFKIDAYHCAEREGWSMDHEARRCGALNTVIRIGAEIICRNTDVDGFAEALDGMGAGDRVAVVGAGGSARAAVVAAERLGVPVVVFNRGVERARRISADFDVEARDLAEVASWEGSVLINTIPSGRGYALPAAAFRPGALLVDLSYGSGARETMDRARGVDMKVYDGMSFLRAQAREQSRLFGEAVREGNRRRIQ